MAGSFYSMADITAMIVVDFAQRLKIPMPDGAENLHRWYDAVASRPGAAV